MLTDCAFSGFANLQLSGAKEGLRLMRRCKLGWAQDGCAEERSEARRTFMIGCKTAQPFFVKPQSARRRCQWHCFLQWTDAAMRCLLPQVQQQAAVAGTAKLAENGRSGPIPSASGPTQPVFLTALSTAPPFGAAMQPRGRAVGMTWRKYNDASKQSLNDRPGGLCGPPMSRATASSISERPTQLGADQQRTSTRKRTHSPAP
jgi:hypothetical protein